MSQVPLPAIPPLTTTPTSKPTPTPKATATGTATTGVPKPSPAASTSQLRLLILEPALTDPDAPPSPPTSGSSSLPVFIPTPQPQERSQIPDLLEALTGEAPVDGRGRVSFAGYTNHPPLRISNRWLDVRVGVWCDEVPFPSTRSRTGRFLGGNEGRKEEVTEERPEDWGSGADSAHVEGGESIGRGEKTSTGNSEVLGRNESTCHVLYSDPDLDMPPKRGAELATAGQSGIPEGLQSELMTTGQVSEDTTDTWLDQMLSPAAAEVRSVIGAVILVISVAHALETASLSSSTTLSELEIAKGDLENHSSKDEEDEALILPPSTRSSWKLKDSYLDVVSAIDAFRSTLEEERANDELDSDAGDIHGNVAVILILQGGALPSSPHLLPGQATTLPTTTTTAEQLAATVRDDEMIEAIEEQLLTSRSITGWDVVYFSGDTIRPLPSGNATRAETGTRRNIYGEKTGIDRAKEVLEAVDWSALPSSSNNTTPITKMDRQRDEGRDRLLSAPNIDNKSPFDPRLLRYGSNERYGMGEDKKGGGEYNVVDDDNDDDDDDDEAFQVEHLESLLHQALVIREAGKDMPRRERERLARRMVGRYFDD